MKETSTVAKPVKNSSKEMQSMEMPEKEFDVSNLEAANQILDCNFMDH